ncbi:GlsB/YeaQ/YmgE family stress response membrane protein [Amycolatopsis cihanbeyliensis]|uniref:Putative membrane protein YeaQ/YmgE (Transglycosylase-associated protein family) n=1 Tax=Amycolatopsis cihanbeyliensis TaxID=1128664 RepID=A0A542DI85_AMYCI|nr:GlsB/YeaQ/YmgE family stress response membrane protein [Amycolatopsis cihanbeyliensis]TQJ02756.1 putative membrane protein YeaQ/YmgE (transglycosylase-associated protein family) [Amycolatopsis cihanbeyliensis]
MGIIAWMVLGLVAGIVAKLALGAKAKHGVIVTILVGIAGALIGGWVASTLFGVDTTQGFFDLSTWVTATLGAVILLLIYHAITAGRGNSSLKTFLRAPRTRR